jgi:hypothetical protein
MLTDNEARRIVQEGWMLDHLPYCLRDLDLHGYAREHGIIVRSGLPRHVWLPLNRRYKPLGFITRDWIDYYDHVDAAMVFLRDPRGLDIWLDTPHEDTLYLYNNKPGTRRDYFPRLERLATRCRPFNTLYDPRKKWAETWRRVQAEIAGCQRHETPPLAVGAHPGRH